MTMEEQINGILHLINRFSGDIPHKETYCNEFIMLALNHLESRLEVNERISAAKEVNYNKNIKEYEDIEKQKGDYKRLMRKSMKMHAKIGGLRTICKELEQHAEEHMKVEMKQCRLMDELYEKLEASGKCLKTQSKSISELKRKIVQKRNDNLILQNRIEEIQSEHEEKIHDYILQINALKNKCKTLEKTSKFRQNRKKVNAQSNDDEKTENKDNLGSMMIKNILPNDQLVNEYNGKWNSGKFQRIHKDQVSWMMDYKIKGSLMSVTQWKPHYNEKNIWIANPSIDELLGLIKSRNEWDLFPICSKCAKSPQKKCIEAEWCRNYVKDSFYKLKEVRNKIIHWDETSNSYSPQSIQLLIQHVWSKTMQLSEMTKNDKELDKTE